MECRLGKPPLSKVELSLARQQAVAEETFGALERASLPEVLPVRDEHIAHEVGMADDEEPRRSERHVYDVAVRVHELGEVAEPIACERDDVLARPAHRRSWRKGARHVAR